MKLTEIQKEQRRMLKAARKADPTAGRLKKTIMYIDIGHLDYDQWVKYRKEYIGGSDVSSIVEDENGATLNPYQSKLEVFHEKVGVISKTGNETEATYSGHVLEDHIRNHYWQYHDMLRPDPEVLMANAKIKQPMRYARQIKDKMMYDPRFPHLKINLDGFIQNTRFEKSPRGILEIKSGLGRVWNEYIAGIPVFYILQVQTYLLVTGLKYAEVAVLLDGRYFKVFPITANKAIQDKILEDTTEFWALVEEGRLIWNDHSLSESEKIQALSVIEPPVNGTAAVDKYLKERFRSDYKAGQIQATEETTNLGNLYLIAGEAVKKEDETKKLYANQLKKYFLDNKVDEIVDMDGKVLMSNRKTDPNRAPVLRVSKNVKDFL